MKHFEKVLVYDKAIVAVNADIEKYLNFETCMNGDLIGNVSMRYHNSKQLTSIGDSELQS